MPKKALAKIVTTLGTFDVTLTDKTTGQNLLDDIAKAVGLEETWWFGLLHKSGNGEIDWIQLSKPVLNQVFQTDPVELELSVRCHPTSIENLHQDITIKLFYHHVKDIVLNGNLPLEQEMLFELASLQAIASYGPFISDVQDTFVRKLLKREKFFPTEFDITEDLPSTVKSKILEIYEEKGSMLKEDAMECYLKIATNIPGLMNEQFDVTTRERKTEKLELTSEWMAIYPSEKVREQESTRKVFKWDEIRSASSSSNRVTIKPANNRKPNIILKTERAKKAAEISDLIKCHLSIKENLKTPVVKRFRVLKVEQEPGKQRIREEIGSFLKFR